MTLQCPTCGLKSNDIPTRWRFMNGKDGSMICQHWFGIPASKVPPYDEISFDEIVWSDGGEALREGLAQRYTKWERSK